MTFITCKFGTPVMPVAPERKKAAPKMTLAEMAAIESRIARKRDGGRAMRPASVGKDDPLAEVAAIGTVTRTVYDELTGEATSEELAAKTGLNTKAVKNAIDRLRKRGAIAKLRMTRSPHCNSPVAVWSRCEPKKKEKRVTKTEEIFALLDTPKTVRQLSEATGYTTHSVSSAIFNLRKKCRVERVARIENPDGGTSIALWARAGE